MKYIFYISILLFAVTSCQKEIVDPLDDIDLQSEFPDAAFSFDFDYGGLRNGELIFTDTVLYPTPLSTTSFSSFKATSDIRSSSNIRSLICDLKQGLHSTDSTKVNGRPLFADDFTMSVKLNIAFEGDIGFGTSFSKSQLEEFLVVGKEYSTKKDSLGSIEITGDRAYLFAEEDTKRRYFFGLDQFDNIGESDYTVAIEDVEDYEDRTRQGALIKKALKVTLRFDGIIGTSSNTNQSEETIIDQIKIENGKLIFLADYQQ